MANMKNYISEIVETIQAHQVEMDGNGNAWAEVEELGFGNLDLNELASILPAFGYELFIEREPVHISGYWYTFEYVRVQEL